MLKRLKPKSEFSRNVLTLMTGTTIAQAIPIAISPILTRIYTPEDFGVFALFMAIASIFGSIANGRYEVAIMLPKKDEDAINILALGFIINIVISGILFFIVLTFHTQIVELLNNKDISPWLYFIPLSVFLTGCFNLLNYFNNRKKQYKDLAKTKVAKSVAASIVQLSLGFMKTGALGLVSGQLTSQIVSNIKLFLNIKKLNLFIYFNKIKIFALAKRYKDFPKFSMWAILANTLAHNLTDILISSFYDIKTLGIYSLTQRLLRMPSSLIGGSIGEVFFQEATKEKQQTGKAINSFNSTIKKLLILGLPSFGILFFIAEDLFAFIFGEDWRLAGTYARIITPLIFIQFIVRPLMIIDTIFEKQKFYLYSQIFYLFMIVSILYVCRSYDFSFLLKIITLLSSIYYLLYLHILNLFSKARL